MHVCVWRPAGGWPPARVAVIHSITRPAGSRRSHNCSTQQFHHPAAAQRCIRDPAASTCPRGCPSGTAITRLSSTKSVSDHLFARGHTPWWSQQQRCSLAAHLKWRARPDAGEASLPAPIAITTLPVCSLGPGASDPPPVPAPRCTTAGHCLLPAFEPCSHCQAHLTPPPRPPRRTDSRDGRLRPVL